LEPWRWRATIAWRWGHAREARRRTGRERSAPSKARHTWWHGRHPSGHTWRWHTIRHRPCCHRCRRHSTDRRHHAHSSPSWHTASGARDKALALIIISSRRRSFVRQADHRLPSQDDEPKRPPLLDMLRDLRIALLALLLDPPELLTVCEHEVHVLVEGEHLAHERPTIVEGDPDIVVDQIEHPTALGFCGSHDG